MFLKKIKSTKLWCGTSLALFLQCVIAASLPLSAQASDRIINGESADFEVVPWVVAIKLAGVSHPLCTGTIIGDYTVLTAAHCVVFPDGNTHDAYSLRVLFGTPDVRTADSRRVVRIYPHRNYDPLLGSGSDNDLAVLVVEEPFLDRYSNSDTGAPVALNTLSSNFHQGAFFTGLVAGYGQQTPDGLTSTTLSSYGVRLVHPKLCRQVHREVTGERVTKDDISNDKHICFWPEDQWGHQIESGVCNGDSGGPLLLQKHQRGFYEQIAVVNWTGDNCDPAIPVVAVLVDRSDFDVNNLRNLTPELSAVTAGVSRTKSFQMPPIHACRGVSAKDVSLLKYDTIGKLFNRSNSQAATVLCPISNNRSLSGYATTCRDSGTISIWLRQGTVSGTSTARAFSYWPLSDTSQEYATSTVTFKGVARSTLAERTINVKCSVRDALGGERREIAGGNPLSLKITLAPGARLERIKYTLK